MNQKRLNLVKGWIFAFVLIISPGMFAQTRVQGTVADEGGTPMIGVNVIEKETSNGTITDLNGHFILNVASPSSVLVFSYVGISRRK